MAWGKKPWQGGTKKKPRKKSRHGWSSDYDNIFYDFTSQYRSKRESDNTVKGFLSMLVFIAVLVTLMFGLILFFNWVAVTF
ncbi:MAG: hypothetical protein ABJF11_07700 [Reichenbachiella sp.]|uniref:hypothetical protein n=1 Tax=Reichenbachiella sp. TaxID=2184521 RepID=UPI0032651CF4